MKPMTRSLITLGVLGTLGGAIAWYAYQSSDVDVVARANDTKKRAKQIFKFERNDIAKIEITKIGNVATLERLVDSWWVTSPVRVQASNSTVRTVLNNIITLVPTVTYGGTGPKPPDVGETGLDSPDSRVRIWRKGSIEPDYVIDIGDDSEFDSSVFTIVTSKAGTGTYGLPKQLRSIVLKSASEFFDRRIFGGETAEFIKVRVTPRVKTDAQAEFVIQRRQKSKGSSSYAAQKIPWQLIEPISGVADSDVVRAVLESLSSSPAQEFLTLTKPKDLSQYGLNDPDWTITTSLAPFQYTGDKPVVRVVKISSVRQDNGQLTVNITRDDQPWVARSSASMTNGLARSGEELRTKRLFAFDVDDVARVEMRLKQDVGDITLERRPGKSEKDTEWSILAPEPGLAMKHKVIQLLLTWVHIVGTDRVGDLTGDAAKDAALLKRTGLDDKAQTMTFIGADKKTLGVLRIGTIDAENLFVTASKTDFVIRVPAMKLTEVPAGVEHFTTR